jgi:glycine/D-amino acid oxidase-like deaminating enzyme
MSNNHSPWIHQLKLTRDIKSVTSNVQTDIVIVGGGIAGISTAYFILKNTNRSVVLLEAGRVAHGATGHNAGQIVSYFEKQIVRIAEEFGVQMAIDAQKDIDSTWGLLQDIVSHLKLETPLYQFDGYAGISSFEEIQIHLDNALISYAHGIQNEKLIISDCIDIVSRISKKYDGLYTIMSQDKILEILETENQKYIAALSAKKGCINSAAFSEEVTRCLMSNYASRFSVFEHSPMSELNLHKDKAILKIKEYQISAKKVILCTNGFENFVIKNIEGVDIDKTFHQNIRGTIGYMAAYLADQKYNPVAISYLDGSNTKDPYFYLTRRPYDNDQKQDLICVGGPESVIEDTNGYSKTDHLYPDNAVSQIDTFLHSTYKHAPLEIEYKYKWHGLMGYTPNGIRIIGEEPANSILMYNLGCNGIGILPSIFGGYKISRILKGEKISPSIFDPKCSG